MTAASRFRGRFLVLFAPLCLAALMSPPTVAADPPKATPKIDYGRDIRPILADNCYACHGPDDAARKGNSASTSATPPSPSWATACTPSSPASRPTAP